MDHRVVPTLADRQARRDRTLDVAQTTTRQGIEASRLLETALAGEWGGTLDYRDFGNDGRVTLPTRMASDGRRVDWTFDDGPGKTVRESARWAVDPTGRRVDVTGSDAAQAWRIAESRTSADGAITLVLDGTARENGRTVVARTVLTRDGDRLRITRMTHGEGEPFLMRHAYKRTPSRKSANAGSR